MGMDVMGKMPTSYKGEYFRNTIWYWGPLADYMVAVAPSIMNSVDGLYTNDGDGLNARDAVVLANVLDTEIRSGRTAKYAREFNAAKDATPSENCDICGGTGVRTDKLAQEHPEQFTNHAIPDDAVDENGASHPRRSEIGWCNGCDGRGHRKSFSTWMSFTIDNVLEWSKFVRHSGGFEIC